MGVSFNLRDAGIRDILSVYRLERACFDLDAWPVVDILAVLIMPGIIRLKAVVNGELVGFIAGDARRGSDTGWIVTLGVLGPYRRSGIATRLLQACEERLQTAKVRLSVRRSNEAAIQLYRRHGYYLVDTWPRYYVDREDALVLEKKLDFH